MAYAHNMHAIGGFESFYSTNDDQMMIMRMMREEPSFDGWKQPQKIGENYYVFWKFHFVPLGPSLPY